jgi:hypothetical protein
VVRELGGEHPVLAAPVLSAVELDDRAAPGRRALEREKVSGWSIRYKLADASEELWEYSYERLKLAQLLGQLHVFLTLLSLTPPWNAHAGPHDVAAAGRKSCRIFEP